MKLLKLAKRGLALIVCLVMMLAVAAPAMADITMHPRMVTQATPVYEKDSTTSTQLGSFSSGDIVGVTAKNASNTFYQIYDQTTKLYGWVPMAVVANTNTTSSPITPMRAINNSLTPVATTTTTTTATSTGTAGYITNCNSWVYYRSSASTASSAKAGKISKNAVVSILGTSGSFTKCLYNGNTVFIDSRYVTSGTPSSSGGSVSSGSATITNCSSWVSMRKSASSSSTRLYKLNKGTVVTVLGTSGSYTKVSYNGKTGFVLSTYVSAGSSTATSTSKTGTGSIRVPRNSSTALASTQAVLKQYQGINSDVVGVMNVLNGFIVQPIMYENSGSFFYHTHDYTKAVNNTGAVYSLYNGYPRNNVISGHNMRTSGGMFHKLHHLQERAKGYNTCQAVNAGVNHSIADVPDLNLSANRIWDITFAGYTQWQLWAFYEVDANEPASTITFNCQHLSASTSTQIKNWIDTQISRARTNSKGYYYDTDLSSDDVFLTIITCGDGFDSDAAQSRLYFFLKAYK